MNKDALIYYSYKHDGDYNKILKAIKNKEDYQKIEVDAITIFDDEYPKDFFKLKNPPFVFYYKGDLRLLKKRKISIVGSRIINEYSKSVTSFIVKNLIDRYVTCSGLAKGIDSLVHSLSLETGTIAIIGCGIKYIYPKENKTLYENIKQKGLIISEYPDFVKPYAKNFPFRNRLIAALGEKIIVPSCKENSGTMYTVNEALELNKVIYACPTNFFENEFTGCNQLIQEGAEILMFNEISQI